VILYSLADAILSRRFPCWDHARQRRNDPPGSGLGRTWPHVAGKRYPLTAFFVLACALSWWPWILYAFDLAPNPIVGVGPFLAALVVLAVTEGKSGVMGLLAQRPWSSIATAAVERG
jgi:hypothetical protein